MKIQSAITRKIYEFSPRKDGQAKYLCPECSAKRKPEHRGEKCFSWDAEKNRGYCHNCQAAFFEYRPFDKKQYVMPEWKNITKLSDKVVKYFEGRMIKQEALNKMRIYSDIETMPQFNKEVEVICFPYFFDGRLVNIKYRGPKKSFKLVAGAELIFYNQDVLREYKEVIITEGEIDTLSFITQGYFNVMSVPNGAGNKLEYLDPYIELFNGIEKIYLATDSDTRGIELRDELIRRLGAERCYLINFKDCKDANEFLCKYGPDFHDLIPNAQPVPLKGIVSVDNIAAEIYNLYEEGIKPGVKIGLDKLDNSITWELGRLCMVTGIPSSGKSEFVDFLVTRLNILYGWKAAYFTPENYPLKYHYAKLYEKIIGKEFKKGKSNNVEYDMAYEYIRENFFYILNEEDLKLSTILTAAKILVKTRGIKILVIDPWNKIDHQFSDSETRYISRALDEIINLAKFSNLLIFLVAHPTKMGKGEIPSLYNISGSAHFFNKPDYGFTIDRKADEQNILQDEVDVHIQKIKYKHLGKSDVVHLFYDKVTGRFKQGAGSDLSNWLIREEEKEIEFEIRNEDAPY